MTMNALTPHPKSRLNSSVVRTLFTYGLATRADLEAWQRFSGYVPVGLSNRDVGSISALGIIFFAF